MTSAGGTPPESLDQLRAAVGAQYAVERLLGQGGMGAVYLARDITLDRPVAIKVINPDVASNATLRQRLEEARTVAKLRHPNIVSVYAAGESNGLLYFVMEFVPGESLREVTAREKRLPSDRVQRILEEIALALHHAHAQGLVHRDVKPENILIDSESGRAMLTDFGVARAFEQEGGLTQTGMILGSPRYMSPEQASGDRAIDGRSDLYSLALVGYELLTGAPVIQSGTVAAMLVKHLTETPPPIAEKVQGIPPNVAAAIDHGLAKDPDQRWQTGREFAEALAGHALSPTGAALGARAATPARAKRNVLMIAASAVVVLVAAWLVLGRGGKAGNAYLVAPFEIQSGEQSIAWLHDASVNMLTLTLGQWGDLQVVDYERTLSLLDKAGLADKTRLSLDDALKLARRANAGTVVMGQIQTIHDSLLVIAKLYDVRRGKSTNQAQEGAALGADPRPLFDRLAQKLLQIAGGPTSTLQLAQATTTSIEAYRAYLNGVKLLNAWRLNDADTAFAHATDVDSTFALAFHKRSLGIGWSDGIARPDYLTLADRALALAGRLPAREQSLIAGHNHLAHALAASNAGDQTLAAAEFAKSVKAYTDLFARGDTLVAEAWYGQADAYYHGRLGSMLNADLVTFTTRALRGFNKTLAIDSTFHLAYSHLVQIYNAAAANSALLIAGDSAILVPDSAGIRRIGGPAALQRLRDTARARGIAIARAWTRADARSSQPFVQLAQSYYVAGQTDSALAVLRESLSQPRAAAPSARIAQISFMNTRLDTGLAAAVRYISTRFTKDSMREVPIGQRINGEGDLFSASVAIGRTADLEKSAQLFLATDPTLPGSQTPSGNMIDFYTAILRVAMGEPMTDAARVRFLGSIRGFEQVPGPVGEQARNGSISVPYFAFLATRDTTFLGTFRRWSKSPTPELDALVALAHHDTATALKLAKAFPRPDSLLKADAKYSLAGLRGIARAQVLADLGLTRQAAETYEAITPDHLLRSSFADPGYPVWVRSLLARARLWAQLGERDKAVASYQEFISRWKDADGIAAQQVTVAKQELAQLGDAPKKR